MRVGMIVNSRRAINAQGIFSPRDEISPLLTANENKGKAPHNGSLALSLIPNP